MNKDFTPHQIDKMRDSLLDPGDTFAEAEHHEDCTDDECEGDCSEYEPDWEQIIQDRIEYETDAWLDKNGY